MPGIVSKVFSAERAILRVPRTAIERVVGQAVSHSSLVRRTVETGMGTLQSVRARTTTQADTRDAAPTPAPEVEIIVEEQAQIVEALLSDETQQPQVGELAEEPEDVRREMAEIRAKHLAQERAQERELKRKAT